MLATKMIAVCDHAGCKARTKVTVLMRVKQATKATMNPIVLRPIKFVFKTEGWTWGWTGEETSIGCPTHPVKR